MLKHLSVGIGLMLVYGCASLPLSSSDFVLIDRTEDAYAVYAGIPKEKHDEIKTKLTTAPQGIELVAWQAFVQKRDEYIRAKIVTDDYPGSKTIPGVIELVRRFPGAPVGVTWNGGIAITTRDYQYAKRLYEQYKANPASYEHIREPDLRADPVNPKGHLGPLLGW